MIKAKQNAQAVAEAKGKALSASIETLHRAARLAIDAKAQQEAAKAGKGNALELMVAALMQSTIWNMKLTFDVKDRGGDIVEHCKGVPVSAYAQGFKNEDGTEYRAKTSAFRSAVMSSLFGVDPQCASVWTVFTFAFKTALELRANGMNAKLVNDKLAVSGGKGERAKALREAATKSTSALVNLAKGGSAGKGTNVTPQNDNGKPAIDLDGALRTVAAYTTAIKEGNATPSNVRLSYLRKIVSDATKAIAEIGDE